MNITAGEAMRSLETIYNTNLDLFKSIDGAKDVFMLAIEALRDRQRAEDLLVSMTVAYDGEDTYLRGCIHALNTILRTRKTLH